MASVSPTSPPNGIAANGSMSPRQSATPKNVAFELLFTESPQYRARLPMRVQIYPHDTTDSIVTTVKNFYGLYSSPTSSKGVSFEDEQGNTLIARYENFRNNMVVYVRVIEEPAQTPAPFGPLPYQPAAPLGAQVHYTGEGVPLQGTQRFDQDISRPNSRTSRKRSPSPGSARGRRSASASTNPAAGKTARSRSGKSRTTGSQNGADGYDSHNGYSSGDGAPGSASGKAKDQIGNTEISLENIVEGGRRKRAKFESSELPLFAPPQMPAATSNPSVSPARRMDQHRSSLSYAPGAPNPFSNPRPLQSPQSYSNGYGHVMYTTPDGHRSRGSIGYAPNSIGISNGIGGILPTPDPTVGSCVSEEDKDVAIQLMRLGEMSNISHGRTSASTLDDTFSGRADIASSTGATSDGDSDSEDELPPPPRRQKLNSGVGRPTFSLAESSFAHSHGSMQQRAATEVQYTDAAAAGEMPAPERTQTNLLGAPKPKLPLVTKTNKTTKPVKSGSRPPTTGPKTKKATIPSTVPMSPASLPPSRKQSISSGSNVPQPSIEDEHPDLSTKPRCQRCRKSKKGCDRQRPCGRCRDAGLSADQCVSEDEGNGRKGRYGRHMGVPLKKDEMPAPAQPSLLPAAPIMANPISALTSSAATATATMLDKSKKRKR